MNVRRLGTDRVAGAAMLVLAGFIGWESRSFTVRFVTDPLGPKALPLFVASMLAIAGVYVLARPTADPAWPARQAWRKIVVTVITFLVYAGLLYPLGFFLPTAAVVFLLALLFGGTPVRSAIAAVLFAGFLQALFGYVLGLTLPVGALFLAG